MKEKTIAIIAAKAKSQGVPRKNMKSFAGGPGLLERTINSAKLSGAIDEIYILTQDDEIKEIAQRTECKVIDERESYTYDLSTESYLRYACDQVEKQGVRIGILVFLQATSPFTTPEIIQKVIEKITKEKYDSAITGFKTTRYFGRMENGHYIPFRTVRKRRQEMEPWICDNGAVYAIHYPLFKKIQNRSGGRIGVVEMKELESLEVDEEEDWWLAERIVELKRQNERKTVNLSNIKLIVTDFDGVLTDDTIKQTLEKEEVVRTKKDSMGVDLLDEHGFYDKKNYEREDHAVDLLILSREGNKIIEEVGKKIKIKVLKGITDKKSAFLTEIRKRNLGKEQVLYIGNDINDLQCMQEAGVSAAPVDANEQVRKVASWIVEKRGGQGVLREVIDKLLHDKSFT